MIRDIKPQTPLDKLKRHYPAHEMDRTFGIDVVAPLLGMRARFIRDALSLHPRSQSVTLHDVLTLLELDAYSETFVQRSRIPEYLLGLSNDPKQILQISSDVELIHGNSLRLLPRLEPKSIQCVVTSSPYWGMRIYDDNVTVHWADNESCPYGFEQTPEGFVRHTVEMLHLLRPAMALSGSVWWNLMDTYNTQTAIRRSVGAKTSDRTKWSEQAAVRYSSGHHYLDDGELCNIPMKIAERASKIGYRFRTMFTWQKPSISEPAQSRRASRQSEQVLYLTLDGPTIWNAAALDDLPPHLGGRRPGELRSVVSDVWHLPVASGKDGHRAAFATALPGRCIALSTNPGDRVLDHFMGSGTTAIAGIELRRPVIGFDVSKRSLEIARTRSDALLARLPDLGARISSDGLSL